MRQTHSKFGSLGNRTTLRLLYYPVMTELKEGQIRLGEHTDYGTMTLLFQDQVGGLQVNVLQASLGIHYQLQESVITVIFLKYFTLKLRYLVRKKASYQRLLSKEQSWSTLLIYYNAGQMTN